MNTPFLKKIGTFAISSIIATSIFVPVVASAAGAATTTVVVAPNASSTASSSTPSAGPDGSFIPLTQLPGLSSISNATSFSSFLNTLYKICIGLGAVLAVLMIMYAGVLIMTSSGSVSGNEKAKSYIQNAILGLVLVLTPTIVFGIINPSILNINIGAEFAKLSVPLQTLGGVNTAAAPGTFTGADTYLWQDTNNSPQDAARCSAAGGSFLQGCGVNADGSGGTGIPTGGQCPSGQAKVSVCKAPASTPTTGNSCIDTYARTQAYPMDQAPGYCVSPSITAPHGCCAGANAQNTLCCATPKTAAPVATSTPQPAAVPAPTNTVYAWAKIYENLSGKFITAQGGRFATQQACKENLAGFKSSIPQEKVSTISDGGCDCDKTISAYPNCPVH